jgi:hypothetical protein
MLGTNEGMNVSLTVLPLLTRAGARGEWTFSSGSPSPHGIFAAGNDARSPTACSRCDGVAVVGWKTQVLRVRSAPRYYQEHGEHPWQEGEAPGHHVNITPLRLGFVTTSCTGRARRV